MGYNYELHHYIISQINAGLIILLNIYLLYVYNYNMYYNIIYAIYIVFYSVYSHNSVYHCLKCSQTLYIFDEIYR